MPSQYTNCWGKIFDMHGGIEHLLNRVRSEKLVSIHVDELRKCSEKGRQNWNGKVVISNKGIVGSVSGAHVNALKHILPEHILPEEEIECQVRVEDGKLLYYMRVYTEITRRPPGLPIKEDDILNTQEQGEFYVLVSSFEKDLRNFIETKLGKGFVKRLENDLPPVVDEWKKRAEADRRWGIEPERDLINYALLTDYTQIIKKYRRIFASDDEESGEIVTNLKIYANNGRNPLMHCRTLTSQKYYATKAAVDFLRAWIERRTKPENK